MDWEREVYIYHFEQNFQRRKTEYSNPEWLGMLLNRQNMMEPEKVQRIRVLKERFEKSSSSILEHLINK